VSSGDVFTAENVQRIGTKQNCCFFLSFFVAIFDLILFREYNRSQRFGKHRALPTKTLTQRQREFQRNYERCKRLPNGWTK